MVAGQKVNELAERKKLLLAQSEAHRLLLRLECETLRSSLDRLQPVARAAQAIRPYGWALGGAAGLMLAWRGRSLFKWTMRGLAAWRLLRQLSKWAGR